MCGQVGVILGTRHRAQEEVNHLVGLFIRALIRSERRGPHASGVAWVNRYGEHAIYKQPLSASQFAKDPRLYSVIRGVDGSTTILMGHTRWKTRGDQHNNANNHPIRAGDIIGTHNGTIINADSLFRRFGLQRSAEVDSEVIFRIADSSVENGVLQVLPLMHRLSQCRGQMSAVMVSRQDPETIVAIKGNKPLEFCYHPEHDALLYTSERTISEAAVGGGAGWGALAIPSMSLLVFHSRGLTDALIAPLAFKTGKAVRSGLGGIS